MKRKALRRTPFKPKAGKKWKPLKRVGKKMKGSLVKYGQAKLQYLEEHLICEVCCKVEATQLHHKAGRLNALLWDKRYFLAVCFDCHQKIETKRAWAIENGYSLDRLTKDSTCSYE